MIMFREKQMNKITYFIKRETDIPWDRSEGALLLEGSALDIVTGHKNSGLASVADFIVENNVIVKSDPRTHNKFKELYESQYGPVDELLLG